MDDQPLRLTQLRNILAIASNKDVTPKFVSMVVDIERYLTDVGYHDNCDDDDLSRDTFDITISDRTTKAKFVLSHQFNSMVYKGLLRVNCIISILRTTVKYNEADVLGEPYVFIEDIKIISNEYDFDNDDQLQFSEEACKREVNSLPLASRRSCYLPLWNDVDYYGNVWDEYLNDSMIKLTETVAIRSYPNIVNIADVVKIFDKRSNKRKNYPPILGRIIRKSRLFHYGKIADKAKLPYVMKVVIVDVSSSVTVTLWSNIAVKYFKILQVDDVILVHGYKIRTAQDYMIGADNEISDGISHLEFAVNSSNPKGDIKIISDINKYKDLPVINYNFHKSSSLLHMKSNCLCDIMGLVVYVGRPFRVAKKASQSSSEMWESFWTYLYDGSCQWPIIIRIYAVSQPEIVRQLEIGKVLICTNVLVHHSIVNSVSNHYVFLSTTIYSQLYIESTTASSISDSRFSKITAFQQLLRWSISDTAKNILSNACYGGYYSFPPSLTKLNNFDSSDNNSIDITSAKVLVKRAKELHYRQSERFIMQAIVSKLVVCDVNNGRKLYSSTITHTAPMFSGQICSHDSGLYSARKEDSDISCDGNDTEAYVLGVGTVKYSLNLAKDIEDPGEMVIPVAINSDHYDAIGEYWMLTLLSLNKNAIIDAIFLPMTHPHLDYRTAGYNPKINAQSPFDINTILTNGILPPKQYPITSEYMQNLQRQCMNKRFLFEIDLYNHGDAIIEAVINRGFAIEDNDQANL